MALLGAATTWRDTSLFTQVRAALPSLPPQAKTALDVWLHQSFVARSPESVSLGVCSNYSALQWPASCLVVAFASQQISGTCEDFN